MARLIKRMFFVYFAFIASLCILFQPCLRAENVQNGHNALRGLNLSHGLSDLLVNVIYRSSDGYVWFGTELGLDRFDGYDIKRFPIIADNIRSKRVLAICEGDNGIIYIGAYQGLYSLKPGASNLKRIEADKLDFAVNSLAYDSNGKLYLGTQKGLFIYNTRTRDLRQRLLENEESAPENDIEALSLDMKSHSLWILSLHNLWELSLQSNALTRYPMPGSADARCMLMHNGLLYIGTDGDGIIPFNVTSFSFEPTINVGNGIVTSISVGQRGNLVIGTDGEGISLYSPVQKREMQKITKDASSSPSLRSNSVYSTLVDDTGLLWIGYYQSGVDYTPRISEAISHFSLPTFSEGDQLTIRTFAIHDDYALCGTHTGIYLIDIKAGTFKHYVKPQIDSDLVFSSIFWNGAFYAGTYHGGLYRLDPSTGQIAKFGTGLGDKSIFCLTTGNDGTLWAGTSDGIYVFNPGNPTPTRHITASNSPLPTGNVYDIFFDSNGRGWFCTDNGLATLTGNTISASNFPKGFINKMKVRHIYESTDRTLYFIPDRGDIWKSNMALTKFSKLDDSFNSIYSAAYFIIEDNDRSLLIGTDSGLFRYNTDGSYTILNNMMGSQPPSFTHAVPYKDSDGDVWFGTTAGMRHLDFARMKTELNEETDSPVAITDIMTGGKNITDRLKTDDGIFKISLKDDESDISLRFTDFSYNLPEFFELEVRMEGVDEGWKKIDGRQELHYYDLKRGRHTLHVRIPGKQHSELTLEINKSGKLLLATLTILAFCIIVGGGALFYVTLRRRHKAEIEDLQSQLSMFHEKVDSGDAYQTRQAAYTTTRLTQEECKRLYKKLEAVMKNDRPYTNKDLKSKDLAELIGSSAHALSFLFNQYLHKSYYDYINEYRVNEFKELVKVVDLNKYTLSTLAERCGFSSRASFFRHFKAITGITPAEYLKN